MVHEISHNRVLPSHSPDLRGILTESHVIAVVGLSDSPWKPSAGVAGYMQTAGYRIVPVNPNRLGKLLLGEVVYEKLTDIPFAVDIVNVFRPAQVTPAIARDAVAIGARVLWLQRGISNDEAAAISRVGGLQVVMDRCIAVEHRRLIGQSDSD